MNGWAMARSNNTTWNDGVLSALGGKVCRWQSGASIELRELQYGFFPKVFVTRGLKYVVCAVERLWTTAGWGLRGSTQRRWFRVRCREGTFDLCLDVRRGAWRAYAAECSRGAGKARA